jgi:hypothetical protein
MFYSISLHELGLQIQNYILQDFSFSFHQKEKQTIQSFEELKETDGFFLMKVAIESIAHVYNLLHVKLS